MQFVPLHSHITSPNIPLAHAYLKHLDHVEKERYKLHFKE